VRLSHKLEYVEQRTQEIVDTTKTTTKTTPFLSSQMEQSNPDSVTLSRTDTAILLDQLATALPELRPLSLPARATKAEKKLTFLRA
jgi:hypothetical protein